MSTIDSISGISASPSNASFISSTISKLPSSTTGLNSKPGEEAGGRLSSSTSSSSTTRSSSDTLLGSSTGSSTSASFSSISSTNPRFAILRMPFFCFLPYVKCRIGASADGWRLSFCSPCCLGFTTLRTNSQPRVQSPSGSDHIR